MFSIDPLYTAPPFAIQILTVPLFGLTRQMAIAIWGKNTAF